MEAIESATTRPIVASTRYGCRLRGARRVESVDGNLLEWRRQQPLDVAQQPRVCGRDE